MSDEEFDVLDELYFVQDFSYLENAVDFDKNVLIETLLLLHKKGWIKILRDRDSEERIEEIDITNKYHQYYYLASKEGLLKHNTTD